ncbi:MAG TPA: tyrosine--tRNA ligase [Candidatus Kaiserbacteria bacterium]|nr:tyrosine--tRNA ligase [Candidatus Kaiserbacteria bacterium]
MDIEKQLSERGLIADFSAPVKKIFECKRTVYLGIDPTADSMQLGNLAVILLMKRLGDAGHKLVFLLGGATGLIGDPREKGERPLIGADIVQTRTQLYEKQLKKLLGSISFRIVNNADWLSKLGLIDFLRDAGKYFTVNELVKRDTIRRRLETPNESISYTEFTYALLQGYDYLFLNEKYGCDLQIGGADQWTNILSGVELLRKKKSREVFAFTLPLVTDATGKKFGKTEGNAIWLDSQKTLPFSFYQFWMQLPDDNLETYFKYFTFLTLVEIKNILNDHKIKPSERVAQKALANAVTEIVHGKEVATQSATVSDALFGKRSLEQLSKTECEMLRKNTHFVTLSKKDIASVYTLADALVKSGLATSKGDARRLITAKGIYVNDTQADDINQNITMDDFTNAMILLRKGKHEVRLLILK